VEAADSAVNARKQSKLRESKYEHFQKIGPDVGVPGALGNRRGSRSVRDDLLCPVVGRLE
jgi:hypothetical protein